MPTFDYIPPHESTGVAIEQGYSTIWENNLFYNTWLQPERTFTSRFMVDGVGTIMVRKPADATETIPGKPGRKFNHKNAADSFVPINLCNNYQESDIIYGAALASVQNDSKVKTMHLENVINKINGGVNLSALAALADQSTAINGAALTASNVKAQILAARRQAVENKAGSVDVVLCSPATYETIMLAAGDKFDLNFNNQIASEGRVGRWLGLDFYEVNGFAAPTAQYFKDFESSATSVALSGIDFIMYDHNSFAVVHNLMDIGITEGRPILTGVFAQGEANFGYKVTNDKRAYVRKTAT